MTRDKIEILGVRRGLEDPKGTLTELQGSVRSRGGWAQLVDADHVAGRDHIVSAVVHARRSLDRGLGASEKFELEFLLYLSGERQISRAIEVAGVRPAKPFVAILMGGPGREQVLSRFRWECDASILASSANKLRALGFSNTEIEAAGNAATDLALEKVARVDLLK